MNAIEPPRSTLEHAARVERLWSDARHAVGQGRAKDAGRYFDAAVMEARAAGRRDLEVRACELASEYYASRGRMEAARAYRSRAAALLAEGVADGVWARCGECLCGKCPEISLLLVPRQF